MIGAQSLDDRTGIPIHDEVVYRGECVPVPTRLAGQTPYVQMLGQYVRNVWTYSKRGCRR